MAAAAVAVVVGGGQRGAEGFRTDALKATALAATVGGGG